MPALHLLLQVDTWDVLKQRPGPALTLSQWCTY
jgi:hypothetical protein